MPRRRGKQPPSSPQAPEPPCNNAPPATGGWGPQGKVAVKRRGVRVFAMPLLVTAALAGLAVGWAPVAVFTWPSARPVAVATLNDGRNAWGMHARGWGRSMLAACAAVCAAVIWRPLRRRVTLRPCAALVTGGTEGIGYQLARLLARDGHSVVIVARSAQRLAAVAAELRAVHRAGAHGHAQVHTIRQDLGVAGAAAALHRRVTSAGIRVTLLVNNAGFAVNKPLFAIPPGRVEGMLACNVVTVAQLSRLFVGDMLAHGTGGKVLNLASFVSCCPSPGFGLYAATKSFVHSFSMSLAFNLSRQRRHADTPPVTVTSLCPGATTSKFAARAGMTTSLIFRLGVVGTSEFVAQRGYDAWMNGEAWCIPSMLDYVTYFVLGVCPYWLSNRFTHAMVA